MKELKPCPFCGGEKLIKLEECNNYTICCDFNQGGCGAASGYRLNAKEAIEAWNRRAGEQK